MYPSNNLELPQWTARRTSAPEHRNGFNANAPDQHYQRDRARIIHSASFRSLQLKTQVLGLGEGDFYRTRLTHSLEVAQIGSGIVERLINLPENRPHVPWLPDMALIEAICLAHDLGHPPYGHGGETALNFCMRANGGFEGNAQTLRILARLGEFSPDAGLDLTRRTMLGVLKYPVFYRDCVNYQDTHNETTPPLNLEAWHPPKCLYDEERDVLQWIIQPFSTHDQQRFGQSTQHSVMHNKSRFKSLDASIMEIADDIAYGVHDLEDAVALHLIRQDVWQTHLVDALQGLSLPSCPITQDPDFYFSHLFSDVAHQRKHAISRLVNYLINHIHLAILPDFEHPLLYLQARLTPEADQLLGHLKALVFNHVIMQPSLQAIRHRGQQQMLKLFQILDANADTLLPKATYQQYEQYPIKERAISDYVSALSDQSATRLYNRLSHPEAGSIFDRI